MPKSENKSFGRICVFLTRSCGTLSAIIGLFCGFVTLIPLPTTLTGSISRCIPTGLLLIVGAVIMFFLEAAVIGYCFDRLSFLVKINQYISHWIRFVLYLFLAAFPLLLWCISASTLIYLGMFFLVAALNFMLAIGMKGDHSSSYEKVTLSDLNKLEAASASETEDNETTVLPSVKDSKT